MTIEIQKFPFPKDVSFELISKEAPFKEIYHNQINSIFLPESYSQFSDKRKNEFLLGRLCAYLAGSKINLNLSKVGVNENRSPAWPDGVVGSISHNNSFAIAAISSSNNYESISLDLENVGRISDELFQRQIATSEDLLISKQVKRLNEDEFKALCFSAKESLFKLLNPLVNKFFGFHDAYISKINEESLEFEITLKVELSEIYGLKID